MITTSVESSVVALVPAAILRTAIARTAFARDKTSTRYSLSSALLRRKAGILSLTCTDGRRLSTFILNEKSAGEDIDILLPAECVDKLTIGSTARGMAEIRHDADTRSGSIRWYQRGGERKVDFREAEGRFPSFADLLSHEPIGTVTGLAKDFLELFGVEVRDCFDIAFDQYKTTVTQHRARAESKKLRYEGTKLDVAFNLGYWIEWLETLNGNIQVTITFADPGAAAIGKAGNSTYVLMPVSSDR